MSQPVPSFDEVFRAAVAQHFAFLTVDWQFAFCGASSDDLSHPKDRRTIVRYRSAQAFVDLVLTYIELGLFVYLWPVPNGAPDGPCWDVRPTNMTNFDHFLKMQLGDSIPPLFHRLKRPRYLTDMYNEQPARYAELMASRLPEAIEMTAARFATFGREALQHAIRLQSGR